MSQSGSGSESANRPRGGPSSGLDWLWRRPPVPDLLVAQELGAITYQALILDGIARRVRGDIAIPADLPETAQVRAAAARPLVPPRAVVGRGAAVWVHAGGVAPARIDVLVLPASRRPDPHPERVPHECVLPRSDVVEVGPVRVTSVERTAIDVGRWSPASEVAPLLALLAGSGGLDPAHALGLLDSMPGHRGVRQARHALAAVLDQPTSVLTPALPSSTRARRPHANP